jgi:hypothetical protein
VFATKLSVGSHITLNWSVSVLLVIFLLLCCWVYLLNFNDKNYLYTSAYIFLISSITPFLFILWHPQWLLFVTPAIALTTVLVNNHERFLLFDLVGMFSFIGVTTIFWQNNVDLAMFQSHVLGLTIPNLFTIGDLFSKISPSNSFIIYMSVFWAYLFSQIIFKRSILHNKNCDLVINYNNIRQRFYFGLAIFILPLIAVIYVNVYCFAGTGIIAEEHPGELTKNHYFKQSFSVAHNSELKNVKLFLAAFARNNNGTLIFELFDNDDTAIYKSTYKISGISGNSWVHFEIPKVKLVKNKKYFIRITAPDSKKGNAITWWKSKDNIYDNGDAIIDGTTVNGDFSFRIRIDKY